MQYNLTNSFVTNFFYPMLTACGILLFVNICIFPEFGATYLGIVPSSAAAQNYDC